MAQVRHISRKSCYMDVTPFPTATCVKNVTQQDGNEQVVAILSSQDNPSAAACTPPFRGKLIM